MVNLKIWDDVCEQPAEFRVQRDDVLLDQACEPGSPILVRIWTSPRCLVVSRADLNLVNFWVARKQLLNDGWPVVVRSSGGSAVPIDNGVLNISIIVPFTSDTRPSQHELYYLLCTPLSRIFSKFNLTSTISSVAGAICDGKYNVLVQGKKIAGSSQKWKPPMNGRDTGAALVHAMIYVDMDIEKAIELTNRFYRLAGKDIRYEPELHTTLCRVLKVKKTIPRNTILAELRDTIISDLRASSSLRTSP